MDYQTIASLYLSPSADSVPVPVVPTTPARRLRDALEPIATQGWWSPQSGSRLEALGLGFLDGYVWGRAASLGEPVSSVVVAAFGVFEPNFLAATYEQGRSVASRDAVLAQRELAAMESLASVLGAQRESEASAIADTLLTALRAMDGVGRPLFSGLRQLDVPSNGFGQLWRAAELVREHRGDGHNGACIAAGLDALSMNVLTELWLGFGLGEYSSSRGFSPDALSACVAQLEATGAMQAGELTDVGRAGRLAIEAATDTSQAALVAALGDDLDRIVTVAESMSDALLSAHTFPSDPRKRAAG